MRHPHFQAQMNRETQENPNDITPLPNSFLNRQLEP